VPAKLIPDAATETYPVSTTVNVPFAPSVIELEMVFGKIVPPAVPLSVTVEVPESVRLAVR
jgi:hypothetical protein